MSNVPPPPGPEESSRAPQGGAIDGEHSRDELDEWTAEELRALVVQLRQAVVHRHTIGMAQGILMATKGLTSAAAFDVLRVASNTRNVRLHDVAAELVARFDTVT